MSAMDASDELPRAVVKRIVKSKLQQLQTSLKSKNADSITISKDAILAFSESARTFVHYITAAANDICKNAKRQTLMADDILKAIDEIDFGEMKEPLQAYLETLKEEMSKKRKLKLDQAEQKKKSKNADEQDGDGEDEDDDEEENEDAEGVAGEEEKEGGDGDEEEEEEEEEEVGDENEAEDEEEDEGNIEIEHENGEVGATEVDAEDADGDDDI